MNSKIDKKFQYNSNILEQWHVSITKYYVLSSKEAKQLMRLFLNEIDEKKKCEIRNVIVLGTLEYVYQFLKQSVFVHLICNWFDMEDVINATVETWINYISKEQINSRAHLYTIDSKYTLYSQTFLNYILNNLCSRETCPANNKYSKTKELNNLASWYFLYLEGKQNKPNLSLKEFREIIKNSTSAISEDSLGKIFDIFKYLDRILKINDTQINLEIINSLKNLLINFINMGLIYDNAIWDEKTMLDRIFTRDLARNALILTATPKGRISEKSARRKKEILIKIFYEGKGVTKVANELGVSNLQIEMIESDCLKRIREKYQSWQSDID